MGAEKGARRTWGVTVCGKAVARGSPHPLESAGPAPPRRPRPPSPKPRGRLRGAPCERGRSSRVEHRPCPLRALSARRQTEPPALSCSPCGPDT
ncbi:hypothetical protein VULLAG_LOCUS19037 [Vulpes lagopus]